MQDSRASIWPIVVLLLGALTVRVAWAVVQTTDESAMRASLPDQGEYIDLARSVLRGEGFRVFDDRFKSYLVAQRTPGYPLLVAAVRADLRAVRIVQAIIDTSTVLAMYLLAMNLGLRRGQALFAAALVAVNPFLIYFSGLILTETLFTAMLAWGMVLLSVPTRTAFLLGGIVLALTAHVRPSAIAFPVVLGVAAVFMNRKKAESYQPRRWFWPPVTTMVVITIVILAPWAIRNHHVLGRWVWTSTNSGITSYDGFNPEADGSSNQAFVKLMPQLAAMGEVDRSEYLSARAREWARENPRRVAELTGRKIARTWSPMPLSDQFGRPSYRTVALLYSLPFDFLVILGLIRGRLAPSAKVFLLLPAIYITVVHSLSVGSLRYRIPVEPPMAVIAVLGFRGQGSGFRRRVDSGFSSSLNPDA